MGHMNKLDMSLENLFIDFPAQTWNYCALDRDKTGFWRVIREDSFMDLLTNIEYRREIWSVIPEPTVDADDIDIGYGDFVPTFKCLNALGLSIFNSF